MLSTTYQLDAYKALIAAGGLVTPASATQATSAANKATSLSDTLSALILLTVTYPSTVTNYTAKISAWAEALANVEEDANTYSALMKEYADLSVLVQLTIGWDVYCRANGIDETELPVSAAIGDAKEPAAVLSALSALNTADIVSAMGEINTAALAAVATGLPAALTNAQITALQTAVANFIAPMAAVNTALSVLDARHTEALKSATQAEDAYNKAIAVALINSSINSAAVSSAVSAITPASVMAIIKQGTS
ncbi:hypothetical protein [Enterobacter soli]|uniref:hypothetical protein n=1 Tax=Enterobacter soli TaxID=885040 RepID=UPI002F403EBA